MIMTENLAKNVEIQCPICNKTGMIYFKENSSVKSERGITAVNIEPNLICTHSFIAYIDNNLTMRDSFTCDFEIELPEIQLPETQIVQNDESFSVSLIKLNLFPSVLFNTLMGIFYGKKMILLYDDEFIGENIKKFYDYLVQYTFETKIIVLSRQDYKANKKALKDYIVLDNKKIIQDKDNFIKTIKSNLGTMMTHRFYSELDPQYSLTLLKNEIIKAYTLTNELIELNAGLEETKEFTTKLLYTFFLEKYHFKVPFDYLDLLIYIAETCFHANLKKSNQVTNFFSLI